MYSIQKWDGLAKLAKFELNKNKITTPALFPVVDPAQQYMPIKEIKSRFGFDQVITSAYLMSKRLSNSGEFELISKEWHKLPLIKDYLGYDGFVMMDSGAYQVLLYGDIELDVLDTLDLQMAVKPDLGVIMDHPISYNSSFNQALERNNNTIINLEKSINYFENPDVSWTLPIQGGKYIELLGEYIDKISDKGWFEYFEMFALGSVVPVMINQDYETLVKMIATSRHKLPVNKPLHLFGAGHPAMFALATFLGCDTFDSAAYALMAKDNRYMTVQGTYDLQEMIELPCSCEVCSKYNLKELQAVDYKQRRNLLSAHNLWVSREEIKRIRLAIHYNRLWDLVQQRASNVPKLARATRLAIEYVSTGKLSKLYNLGVPISNSRAVRISRPVDINKAEIRRIRELSLQLINNYMSDRIIVIGFDLLESIHNKIPENQIFKVLKDDIDIPIYLLLPPFGLIPYGINELYPIGQLVHDLRYSDFNFDFITNQFQKALEQGLRKVELILPEDWPLTMFEPIRKLGIELNILQGPKPFVMLKSIFSDN